MVGLKAKARASAYLTKLDGYVGGYLWVGCVCGGVWGCVWGLGCVGVCVGVGVCVCVCEGWIWLGWLGCVRRVGMYWKEGEEKLHHFIIICYIKFISS